MNAIWSLGQAMFTKVIVVVDHDVDCTATAKWRGRRCARSIERDVQFTFGPADTLDHAARMQDYGSKMGMMRRASWATEGFTRPWPDEILMDQATKKRVAELWKSLKFEEGR
jgi:4-hydroxy-3-polyprenylbenzoate decarboxylase